ncbi:hypothetical protein PMAYCL1PPCAC_00465, partial [Pristionchus mayeri]
IEACKTTDSMNILFNELVRQIDEKPFFCMFCKQCMFTAHQTFMHMVNPSHYSKIPKTAFWGNTRLTEMVGNE